jgi:hypothetical protein
MRFMPWAVQISTQSAAITLRRHRPRHRGQQGQRQHRHDGEPGKAWQVTADGFHGARV